MKIPIDPEDRQKKFLGKQAGERGRGFLDITETSQKETPKHKTAVEGYENLLQLLSERVHRMRYDKVDEFYRYTAAELRKQAEGDRSKGRSQLAALLEETADITEQQRERFARIWTLCKPYMEKG
jgi:uncharacterized protein YydD (DUF2326 family)